MAGAPNFYADAACTIPLSNIDWGTMDPGESKTKTVYVKNETGKPDCFLVNIYPLNIVPPEFAQYMTLTSDWLMFTLLQRNQIHALNLTLAISSSIHGITSFSFDVTSDWGFLADLDFGHDGKILIDDIAVVAQHMWTHEGGPRWDPTYDLNQDGKVDITDLALISKFYGKKLTP